jgi:protein phosphatase
MDGTTSPSRHEPRLVVNTYGQTDVGSVRDRNQDHFLIAALHRQLDVVQTSLDNDAAGALCNQSQGWVFVVADGMGGLAGGEEASSLTVETSFSYLRTTMPTLLRLDSEQPEIAEETLRSVVCRCHEEVLAAAAHGPERRQQMGTTLTMAVALWPQLFVAHVGDSRCYLMRNGELRQLTSDHTVARELEDRGVDHHTAARPPYEDALTNVVGGGAEQEVVPEVRRLSLRVGDSLLLCTDGLTKAVPDERILQLMRSESFANARCQALIEAANRAGGPDNTTVVVASFQRLHDNC